MPTRAHLFVLIPAYNEAQSIGAVIKGVPRKLSGVATVSVVVVDDGSDDQTDAFARKAGADYIVRHKRNLGLAQSFQDGLRFCLDKGADIIVHTDADNQYDQGEIPQLIAPILKGKADMVIGDRQVVTLEHMPKANQYGNRLGSAVIRWLTGADVADASSGFRAFSRDCADQFFIFSQHTYTHETIIQAVYNGLKIQNVPITFRPRVHGSSRLISGLAGHIQKSFTTIFRTLFMYKAFKVLSLAGGFILLAGIAVGARFLFFYFEGNGGGHIQSLILASILINLGFITLVLGVLADLLRINRLLLEKRFRR